MFEYVMTAEALDALDRISSRIKAFYLAGGTGLALQLGHRRSLDLDFFSSQPFNVDVILTKIEPEDVLLTAEGTVHCVKDGVKLSFLFYREPLSYPELVWRNTGVADWRDIATDKIKTVSQRGAKKDFYDIFAVLKLRLSIEELCRIFRDRFSGSGINRYHVLKSLVYFEDAESDPEPVMLLPDADWKWDRIKAFFEANIREFEKCLLE
ncbi:MAG: nucleotidyl transferase AbiEii/AbiGii toxin family protein [Pseudomonadota bacterium]